MASLIQRWTEPGTRPRRILVAAAIYVTCVAVFAALAARDRLLEHTPFNHYAHLAHAWLNGRMNLPGGPPAYAMGNDFAFFEGKTYISFPPFPAVLMMPFVALAGSPEDFRDGQFVVWLAGVGPAVLFLVLEKLRRTGRSPRSETENFAFALLFAFGTVYFFTAVQGTVWFAAHVVATAVGATYLLFALDAALPFTAGVLLACTWTTRPPMLMLGLLFAAEAARTSCREGAPSEGTLEDKLRSLWDRLDRGAFARKVALFAAPVLASFALAGAYNYVRFRNPSPFAFGHEYLSVAWAERIRKWGLFNIHFMPKNLGIFLTSLPWVPQKGSFCLEGPQPAPIGRLFSGVLSCAPFRVNVHGLALWFTTPLYFWLARPRRTGGLLATVLVVAALPALADLLYQNSGWAQFGYRFSNDYALLLFIALALGGRPMGPLFKVACAWSIAWNLFGAASFERAAFSRMYFNDGSQQIIYQPD